MSGAAWTRRRLIGTAAVATAAIASTVGLYWLWARRGEEDTPQGDAAASTTAAPASTGTATATAEQARHAKAAALRERIAQESAASHHRAAYELGVELVEVLVPSPNTCVDASVAAELLDVSRLALFAGDMEFAVELAERAVDLCDDAEARARALLWMSDALLEANAVEDCYDTLVYAVSVWEEVAGKDDLGTIEAGVRLAACLVRLEREQEAGILLDKAKEVLDLMAPTSDVHARFYMTLADMQVSSSEYNSALANVRKAQHALGDRRTSQLHVDVMSTAALVYYGLGQQAEAESHYKQAIVLSRELYGLQHLTTATAIWNLALLLYRHPRATGPAARTTPDAAAAPCTYQLHGRQPEARELLRSVVDIRKNIVGETNEIYLHTVEDLQTLLSSTPHESTP